MKQVLQNLKTGQVLLEEVPCPAVRRGSLLIQTTRSLISAGTERMLVEFGRSSLLAKARSQPERVRQVLDKIKTDGLLPTLEAVFSRLDEPLPLGYCQAGVVVEIGAGVSGYEPGDRVISNGAHAEMVCLPKHLCAKIPAGVSDEAAAFTVLGAIGLQGIRLLEPTLGETVAVFGLGLIGLMTVQMLAANGCRVLGIDLDPQRLALARQFGAESVDVPAGADPVQAALALTGGVGVDGVLITASAKSNEIVKQSAQMCRQRGRIVLVGVVGLELDRSDFYQKELTFQVSCSYGPGHYDSAYEDGGHDYPLGFVRWTEQRNFEAILRLMADGQLDVGPLITHRIAQAKAEEAYRLLTTERDALGIVLSYPEAAPPRDTTIRSAPAVRSAAPAGKAVLGVIGAGNFAKMTALPRLAKLDARLARIADVNGLAAAHAARKFGFEHYTTEYRTVLEDPEINAVFVFTRHDLHGSMVLEALSAGKHVFVEKPLCLKSEQLTQIREAYERASDRLLLVGFNRRFSPHAAKLRSLLAARTEPACLSMMVNAGVTPADAWVHHPDVGGGRIIGEGCHWVDLMSYLVGSRIVRVAATQMGLTPALTVRDDKMTITLTFADGSIGTLHYFGNGHRAYQKETLEVFCGGRTFRLDNFRVLRGYGVPGFSKLKLFRLDKGHTEEFRQFVEAVARGGAPVIPFDEIEQTMRATFAAVESSRSVRVIDLSGCAVSDEQDRP